jgi:DNA-binding response OmpR family regulator
VESQPALVLLDVIMPGMNGIEVARQLKANAATRAIPLIFLTGQGAEPDIVAGLELGADDYLTKPFSYSVLVARIRAVLRRVGEEIEKDGRLRAGAIELNLDAHEVTVDGKAVTLTLAEFHLLAALLRDYGRVLTRKQLLESIADSPESLIERNVDVHIGTLRKKLGTAGSCILTVRGVGYKCKDGDAR